MTQSSLDRNGCEICQVIQAVYRPTRIQQPVEEPPIPHHIRVRIHYNKNIPVFGLETDAVDVIFYYKTEVFQLLCWWFRSIDRLSVWLW